MRQVDHDAEVAWHRSSSGCCTGSSRKASWSAKSPRFALKDAPSLLPSKSKGLKVRRSTVPPRPPLDHVGLLFCTRPAGPARRHVLKPSRGRRAGSCRGRRVRAPGSGRAPARRRPRRNARDRPPTGNGRWSRRGCATALGHATVGQCADVERGDRIDEGVGFAFVSGPGRRTHGVLTSTVASSAASPAGGGVSTVPASCACAGEASSTAMPKAIALRRKVGVESEPAFRTSGRRLRGIGMCVPSRGRMAIGRIGFGGTAKPADRRAIRPVSGIGRGPRQRIVACALPRSATPCRTEHRRPITCHTNEDLMHSYSFSGICHVQQTGLPAQACGLP